MGGRVVRVVMVRVQAAGDAGVARIAGAEAFKHLARLFLELPCFLDAIFHDRGSCTLSEFDDFGSFR